MNPNAEMFQSQLYNASSSQQQSSQFGQQQGEFGRSGYQGLILYFIGSLQEVFNVRLENSSIS